MLSAQEAPSSPLPDGAWLACRYDVPQAAVAPARSRRDGSGGRSIRETERCDVRRPLGARSERSQARSRALLRGHTPRACRVARGGNRRSRSAPMTRVGHWTEAATSAASYRPHASSSANKSVGSSGTPTRRGPSSQPNPKNTVRLTAVVAPIVKISAQALRHRPASIARTATSRFRSPSLAEAETRDHENEPADKVRP